MFNGSAPSHVYVVIVNWNGWHDTVECLDSVFQTPGDGYSVIVCDNGSEDDSIARLGEWARSRFNPREWVHVSITNIEYGLTPVLGKRFGLIENGQNLGFAAGNNVGIRLALHDPRCAYIWLLNNDTVVEADALVQAWMRMAADERIGLCGSTLVYYHRRDQIQALGGGTYLPLWGKSRHVGAFLHPSNTPTHGNEIERQLFYVVGAALMVRREFVEQIGLMCEDYFLYFEELDWALRGQPQFRVGYAPRSVVYHKEGASIGTCAAGGSGLSLYYLFRSRIRFTRRFYARYLPTVVVASLLEIVKFALKGRYIQASAALRGLGGMQPPVQSRPPASRPRHSLWKTGDATREGCTAHQHGGNHNRPHQQQGTTNAVGHVSPEEAGK